MATLFDLAQQYLNRALPETFKYDRTPRIGIPTPVPGPIVPEPIKKLLPVQSGGGGGGGGSNNPSDLSTNFSQITSDRQKRLSQDPTGINKFLIDNLGMRRPQTAEDIVNLGYRTPSKFGITSLLPDKYGELPRADQAFIASRMGYTGPTVFGENNSGLSKDPFGLNTRSAFGNYAERVGVEAEKALDNLNRLGDKYNATWDDKLGTFVGKGAKKANEMTSMIQSKRKFYKGEEAARKDYQDQVQNVLDADKEFSTEGDSSNYGIDGYPTYDIKDIMGEDEEDSEIPSFITDNSIVSNNIIEGKNLNDYEGIMSNYPDYSNVTGIKGPPTALTAPITSGSILADKGINRIIDDVEIPSSNNDNNAGFNPGVTPGNSGFIGIDKDMDVSSFDFDDAGTYDGPGITGSGYNAGSGYASGKGSNLGGPAGQGTATAKDAYTDAITRGNTGGGNDSSSNSRDKIVCTMMNESYGFGSFRNKIWLKHSKGLAPEYQKGYHKLFLPLVKIAKTNKIVKKILEHIAVHRTIDIRQESRGKVHLLGRVYRKILEPLCYFVGKHG
tara:strand:- start:30 stop:1697 length:1668 start_codon:yes stop_codon:yes gene_type:complete